MRRAIVLAVSVLAVSFVIGTGATPAFASPEDVANDISSEIMSPFCEGVTLHDCSSRAAEDLRAQILTWAENGWSRDRILAELESRYGAEQISGTPPVRGSGLLAWLLPAAALLGGSVLAFTLARRWARRPLPSASPPVSEEDRSRVDVELAAFKGDA